MEFYPESVTLDDCLTLARLNYYCIIKQGRVISFEYDAGKEVKEIFKEWVTLNQKQ